MDLDAGFTKSVSMEDVQVRASTSSGHEVLADATNVAETVVAAFSQPDTHMSNTPALLRSAILIYGPYKIRTDRKSSYEP